MRMFNADGSEAEMCGNGIRCVAKYLYDHGRTQKSEITIETGRGFLRLELFVRNNLVEDGSRRHGTNRFSRLPTFPRRSTPLHRSMCRCTCRVRCSR